MDRSRELYELIKSQGIDWINATVGNQEENETLEFKRLTNNKVPLQKADKQNLSKSISSFANNQGGVLVWGVEAKKIKPDEADVVQALFPIQGLKALHTALLSDALQLTAGGLLNIEYQLVEEPAGSDSGFLLMHVPHSESEPVMATAEGQHRYYFRSGTGTIKLTHVQIGDMFARRVRPKLEFSWRLICPDGFHYSLLLGVRNSGRVIAKSAGMIVHQTSSVDHYSIVSFQSSVVAADTESTYIRATENFYLHPSCAGYFLKLMKRWTLHTFDETLAFDVEIFCDGFSQQYQGSVSRKQLLAEVNNTYNLGFNE
jgi:hypothetical protein